MHMHDILYYGHLEVIKATEKVPMDKWDLPHACGVWSVKNIIAHLASYELMLIDVFHSLLDEKAETLTLKSMFELGDSWNDNEVAKRQSLSPSDTFLQYKQNHEEVMELSERIPEELATKSGVLSWYGEAYDLDDFLAYSFYGHKREHAAQINAFCDVLEREKAK